MTHNPQIVKGSIRRNPLSGGVEFKITCCGELVRSVHIQSLAAYENDDQRMQVIKSFLDEHALRHATEQATEEFLKKLGAGNVKHVTAEQDLTDCPGCVKK